MLNNNIILSVCSPREFVQGPYTVVYKTEYWAIVTLEYDGEPTLGIRWFVDSVGTPSSHGHPTWFIIPDELQGALLYSLPLKVDIRNNILKFLGGEIDGAKLAAEY